MSHRSLRAALLAALIAVVALGVASKHAFAWSASGPLLPNGSAQGSGSATTVTDNGESVFITLRGARPSATYAIFTCIGLVSGDFNCTDHNLPDTVQQVVVAPKGIAPIVVTLVQQGSLQTDPNGNGTTVLGLAQGLFPDTVHSVYNVVQLVNTADGTDSYTALDLQAPVQPQQGVNALFPPSVALVVGVPVYVFAQFPGYVFPVAINTVPGLPFFPFFAVPFGFFGSPFPISIGLCPNGQPPHAIPGPFGGITFTC